MHSSALDSLLQLPCNDKLLDTTSSQDFNGQDPGSIHLPNRYIYVSNSVNFLKQHQTIKRCLVLILITPICTNVFSGNSDSKFELVTILDSIEVSESQKIAQQTPIDTFNNAVYIANIEAGRAGDIDGIELNTVVRKGVETADGSWAWSETVVDSNTVHDPWHTSPAIGIDDQGYIHIAYNMHNYPWQYSVSKSPEDISGFKFRGDKMSLKEKKQAKFDNKTSFKDMGYADIPGNQITYPAFYKDNQGGLYITYRFAAKPARPYKQRTMSSAIAKYDSSSQAWQSIGGELQLSEDDYKTSFFRKTIIPRALASQTGWTSYHPRLAFGPEARLNVNWFWREGTAGEKLERPCFVYSNDHTTFQKYDGSKQALPASSSDCSNINIDNAQTFYTAGSFTVDSKGTPYILLSPTESEREIYTLKDGHWSVEESPNQATELFVDANDALWAISTGLNIFKRDSVNAPWIEVHKSDTRAQCHAKVALNDAKNTAYIYTQACGKKNTVSVFRLNLLAD